uniref:beta strand repeat-containing protein n=1 Tax=uncultured Polaribacter sp. TaxID=174711 RepID=UPI00261B6D55
MKKITTLIVFSFILFSNFASTNDEKLFFENDIFTVVKKNLENNNSLNYNSAVLTEKTLTIVPGAPTVAPDLTASSDTGRVDSDNVTNNNTPTFTISGFTAAAGDVIKIYADGTSGTLLGSSAILIGGETSVDITSNVISDGTYSITATITNGSESSESPALSTLVIDTVKPTVNSISKVGFNTGTYPVRNTMREVNAQRFGLDFFIEFSENMDYEPISNWPTLSYSPDASVVLANRSNSSGFTAGSVGPHSRFRLLLDPPIDDDNEYEDIDITISNSADLAGNVMDPTTLTDVFSIDMIGPTSNPNTVLAANKNVVSGATITLDASVSANETAWLIPNGDITSAIFQNYTFSANGSTVTTSAIAGSTITAPTAEGVYQLYILDDVYNFTTTPATATITVDNTAPTLTPSVVASIDEGETALGTISANEDVTWTDSSADVSVNSSGVITLNAGASLANSPYTFTITGTDNSNNATTTSQFSVTVNDITPPVISNSVVANIDEGETALGTISANEDVTWTDSSADVSVNSSGVITLNAGASLANSPYTFTITGTDNSNNATTTSQFSVTVNDITPPVISNVTMLSNNNLNTGFAKEGDVITLSFESNETINTPTVTIATETANVTNTSGNNWTATLTVGANTTEGTAAFLISNIADDDNNGIADILALSSGNAVAIDRTAPTGYGINALTNPVNPAIVNISSFAITGLEANSSYNWSISDGNNPAVTGSGTTVSGGTVALTGTINLSSLDDGTLTLTVYSTDQAGNQGADVTDTTTKDTQGPVIVLTGDNPQTLELNNVYIEQGVTSVNDNIDGPLDFTNDGGTIDTSALDNTTVGRYNIVYSIVDSRGNTGTATRVVHVMDTVPTAVDDTFTVNMNSANNNLNILDNDCFGTFGPNTSHSLTLVNGKMSIVTANGGSIAVNNNGTATNYLDDYITYTPEGDYSGPDTFTYTITDTNGIAATATVTVTVDAGVSAEGAVDDSLNVAENSTNNIIDVLANDNFGTVGVGTMLINSPNHLIGTTTQGGTLTLDDGGTAGINQADDKILYTPPTNFVGIDTFDYTLTVGSNQYQGTVTVTVGTPPSTLTTPTAVDDTASAV